jgi:hypothetical protein
MRHKWFKIERTAHEVSTRCGLVKNRRRHGNFHWTEYKATDGRWFTSDKTPACEQPQAVCTENLDTDVLVMQPADERSRRNPPDPLNRTR